MAKVLEVKKTKDPDSFEVHVTTQAGASYVRSVTFNELLNAIPLDLLARLANA